MRQQKGQVHLLRIRKGLKSEVLFWGYPRLAVGSCSFLLPLGKQVTYQFLEKENTGSPEGHSQSVTQSRPC